ncbi:MAG: PcfJ domain-containing protein [Myxococcota bacterium]
MSRRARPPRQWAQAGAPLVSLVRAAKLLRRRAGSSFRGGARVDRADDRSVDRRALVVLRCVDRWAPDQLCRGSVAWARAVAGHPWHRPPDTWVGEGPLVDHLLRAVRYPLPAFLYPLGGAPLEGSVAAEVDRAVGLLAFTGGGGALTAAPGLPPLSRKAAHLLWTGPAAESVALAVRAAQVAAVGGPDWLVHALARTALGRFVADEAWWGGIVAWLAANAAALDQAVDRAALGGIVDWLGATRATPTSVSRMVRDHQQWHRSQGFGAGLTGPLPRSGLGGARAVDADDGARWSFVELCALEALALEGRSLRHCVATYAPVVRSGKSSIWSMRTEGLPVLTLEVWNADRAVVQIRGLGNRRATPTELRVIDRWAAAVGLTVRDR